MNGGGSDEQFRHIKTSILKMRDCGDKELLFRLYFDTLLPCVKHRRDSKYKSGMGKEPIASLFTKTDEAFVLITLEDKWDTWVTHFREQLTTYSEGGEVKYKIKGQIKGASKVATSAKGGTAAIVSDTSTGNSQRPYTSVGRARTKGALSGWTQDGVTRFNQLQKAVVADRQKNAQVEQDYLAWKQKNVVAGKVARKGDVDDQADVGCVDMDWSGLIHGEEVQQEAEV